MTMLLLRRKGTTLTRDVVFMATADEEIGGRAGLAWLIANHPESCDAEYVLNEGDYGSTEMFGVRKPVFNCAVGEKTTQWLRLTTTGLPGHGSVPHDDNSLERLVHALYRIRTWRRSLTVLPEVSQMLERLYAAGVLHEEPSGESLERLANKNPIMRALLTDTVSITMCNAGLKPNVIPASSEATLDCRLLPGHDPEEFIEQMKTVIDDPRVEVSPPLPSHSPVSPTGTDLFRTIEEVVQKHVPEAVVVPTIGVGASDSRFFRQRGISTYGFSPCLLSRREMASIHGNNERISIENLRLGIQILWDVVCRMCT
jgi:acetylornithine deacetylase/succinyl-diaminopimelate desuccinylase-like protein